MRTLNLIVAITLAFFCFYSCIPKSDKKEIIIEDVITDEALSYDQIGKPKLSDYGFFEMPLASLRPAANVYPYELNTPLFTDYALKQRFIFIPEGFVANYQEEKVLDFPEGTVLIKNFHYDETQLAEGRSRIIETRLLILENDEWKALPYIWNEDQTDAFLEITGGETLVSLEGKPPFQYSVPNMAQCKGCHEESGKIAPIGPTARQLNKSINGKNQLVAWQEAGVLSGLPEIASVAHIPVWDDPSSGTLDERARGYLEINCAHCHRPEGPGKNSGLDLTIFAKTDHALGIFKSPVAAGSGSGGFEFDIVPGKPEKSILTYRMKSLEPGVMMPELGRKLIHKEGIELVEEWIRSLQ